MLDSIGNFLTNGVLGFVKTDGLFLLTIIIVVAVAQRYTMRVTRKIIDRLMSTQKFNTERDRRLREKTLTYILGTSFLLMVWIVAILFVLRHFGINLTPILASAGFISLAVGFGAQTLVRDYISGIFILVENQYRVGDYVELNQKISGVVEAFTLRMTSLRDDDGTINYISNNEIGIVTNMTRDYGMVDLSISLDAETDIDKLEKTINEVGQEMADDKKYKEAVLSPPKFLRIHKIDGKKIIIRITGKTVPSDQWGVTGELRRRLIKAFKKNSIELA